MRSLLKSLIKAGINCVEITFRSEYALESIKIAVNEFRELVVCAGAIINCDQAREAFGAGVKFAAVLIYGWLNDYDCHDMIEFAVACSCLKHTIERDFNLVNINEVLNLKNGNGSGKVNR